MSGAAATRTTSVLYLQESKSDASVDPRPSSCDGDDDARNEFGARAIDDESHDYRVYKRINMMGIMQR